MNSTIRSVVYVLLLSIISFNVLALNDTSPTVIIKSYEKILKVKSPGEATIYVKCKMEILNRDGLKYSYIALPEDKFIEISGFFAEVKDNSGRLINKVRKKDLEATDFLGQNAFYDDTRSFYYEFQNSEFPFVVEYAYELKLNGIFILPDFEIPTGKDKQIDSVKFIAKIAPEVILNYKVRGENKLPFIYYEDGYTVHVWGFNNIQPMVDEPFNLSTLF